MSARLAIGERGIRARLLRCVRRFTAVIGTNVRARRRPAETSLPIARISLNAIRANARNAVTATGHWIHGVVQANVQRVSVAVVAVETRHAVGAALARGFPVDAHRLEQTFSRATRGALRIAGTVALGGAPTIVA